MHSTGTLWNHTLSSGPFKITLKTDKNIVLSQLYHCDFRGFSVVYFVCVGLGF